ncbi:MAG: hypothetical protein KOO61_08200 [Spirochaetales bacterium]|nr:hypothetical protein [Spirochaetales bacterium]
MENSTMKDSNRVVLAVMAAIALLMGLYLVLIAPGFMGSTMDKLILAKTKQATVFAAGPLSRLYVGAIYSGFEITAGLALIAISYAIFRGRKWSWPLAMLLLAIPAAANAYIGLGWIENLKQFPPAYITFFLSLAAFWAMLFLKKNDGKTKVAMFFVFTLLGMIASQAFIFFPHALRVIMKSPGAAILDPTVSILRQAGPLMFITVFLALAAVWLLAKRKRSGWYVALVSGLTIAVASFPVHYLRPTASLVPSETLEPSIFTSAYWMAGAQGVILIILLLIPFFKNQLVDKAEE